MVGSKVDPEVRQIASDRRQTVHFQQMFLLRTCYEIEAGKLIRQWLFEIKDKKPWSMVFFNKATRLLIDACCHNIPWSVIDHVGFFAEIEEALQDAEVCA
jgi:hypothetical protein